MARYPLLLGAVLKHTPDDSPDKETLPKVIDIVKEFLRAVNTETGKAENRFNLLQLDQQLVFRPGEQVVSILLLNNESLCSHLIHRTSGYKRKVANSSTRVLSRNVAEGRVIAQSLLCSCSTMLFSWSSRKAKLSSSRFIAA